MIKALQNICYITTHEEDRAVVLFALTLNVMLVGTVALCFIGHYSFQTILAMLLAPFFSTEAIFQFARGFWLDAIIAFAAATYATNEILLALSIV